MWTLSSSSSSFTILGPSSFWVEQMAQYHSQSPPRNLHPSSASMSVAPSDLWRLFLQWWNSPSWRGNWCKYCCNQKYCSSSCRRWGTSTLSTTTCHSNPLWVSSAPRTHRYSNLVSPNSFDSRMPSTISTLTCLPLLCLLWSSPPFETDCNWILLWI